MEKYEHKKVEEKWQKKWAESEIYKTDFSDMEKEKFYLLDMFPYPSGDGLHMGHTEQAAVTDTFYRYKKMMGFNVLHPQGFDSFGLPAENYAIKTGIPPVETISETTKIFQKQIDNLGLGYDFMDGKVTTSDPQYYRWTQWLFGKFFENDIAYKKTAKANWCESCKTVIATEQMENGKCERCGTEIEQKDIPSWMFKITDFADDLIWNKENEEKNGKIDWPESTKKNQNAWIGKSKGAEIDFDLIEPEFVDINNSGGKDNYREGVEEIERFNVVVIIESPDGEEFLCAKWKKVDWQGFVTGGIEDGDSVEETAIKEVQEETGYQNPEIVKVYNKSSHGKFYHVGKKVNRFAHYQIVHVKLKDLGKKKRSAEEAEIADMLWIKKADVNDFLKREDMKYPWRVVNGEDKILDKGDVILMHGKDTNPEKKWYPWLKKKSLENNLNFSAPILPKDDNPILDEWVQELENLSPTKNTILVGHSRGGVAILRWLENQPESFKVKKVILVATNFAKNNNKKNKENTNGFYTEEGFNFNKIKKHCNDFVVLHSEDDEWVEFSDGEKIAEGLNAKFLKFKNRGHFGSTLKKPEIPELLDEVLGKEKIKVFTTRPDTLFGATYMVLAPEHELVQKQKDKITNWDEVEKYISDTKKKTELERLEGKEKTGVELKGISAENPANGAVLPIFISDYVLAGYGTGAIMAVPAHDERDNEFAKKSGIEIKEVIAEKDISTELESDIYRDAAYGIILNDKKEILIQYHDRHKNYRLAGGGIDEGENKEEALKREIIEETGYSNIKIKKQIETVYHKLYQQVFDRTISGLKYFYIVDLIDGKKDIEDFEDDEKMSYQWFSKEDLKKHLENNEYRTGDRIAVKNYLKNNIFSGDGILVNSGEFSGMNSEEAKEKITEFVGGKMTSTYRLRDWSISRQRYWGTPIPIVYSPDGVAKFVGEENLPWKLPTDVDFVPTGTAPLAKSVELLERTEKIFGKGWKPEVDTMDTFVDSSWYFLRYADPSNEKEFTSEQALKKWMPVDLYIGGAEHTYMHLLFARFFIKAMKKIGLVDFNEPFLKLRHQGMVNDIHGKKMSKSKGNVVNPDEMVQRFGADATRTYMLFSSPLEDDVMWNEDNIVGVYRFLEKVWRQREKLTEEENIEAKKELHKTIKSVTEKIEELKFNTAIPDMMKFINFCDKQEKINSTDFGDFVKILSPFAPHICDEILNEFNLGKDWPKFDKDLAKQNSVTMGIQINGKRRAEIEVAVDETEESVKEKVLAMEEVQKWTEGKEIRKFIYVPGRIISVIV